MLATPTSTAAPTFVGVRGHVEACARLHRAIVRGQLHHGIVVVGPPGVGKTTFARGLACALHCAEAPGLGCGRCNACRRVLQRTHVGVEWAEPEEVGGTIKVAVARDLAVRLEQAPFEGSHHLVLFDPAEALNEQAFNALLKTLEEPRPGVHFVLLATRLDALLPTILSRCLVLRLGLVDEADIDAILHEQAAQQADPPPAARLDLARRLADGRPGLAIQLALDPTLDAALELLGALEEAVRTGPRVIFGGDDGPLWSAWATAVGPVKTGRPARERAVARQVCELWLLHRRELMRGRPGLPGVPAPSDRAPRLQLRHLDRIQVLLEGIERNPNIRLALEHTLLDLHGEP